MKYSQKSLFGCEDVDSSGANRSVAKHREHINKLLEQCIGKTKTVFISLTYYLLLIDP